MRKTISIGVIVAVLLTVSVTATGTVSPAYANIAGYLNNFEQTQGDADTFYIVYRNSGEVEQDNEFENDNH